MNTPLSRGTRLILGGIAGVIAALGMILVMLMLRRHLGVATPTEMIFDRMFPIITIDFFLHSLQVAGGYTPLKLKGVAAALGGHLVVGLVLGIIYSAVVDRAAAFYANAAQRRRRGRSYIIPALLGLWILTVALLWPEYTTQYRGWPAGMAIATNAAGLLLAYAAFGVTLIYIYDWIAPFRPTERRTFPQTGTADDNRRAPVTARTATDVEVAADGSPSRRAFLAGGVGAVLLAGVASGLRGLYQMGTFFYDGTDYHGPGVKKVVSNHDFYVVSKNLDDPIIAADDWRLHVGGALGRTASLTRRELMALPATRQQATLLCISYGVGGGLCSNAWWTGVPLRALLAPVDPKPNITTVLFRCADGYFETFPYIKAMEPTTLVAYAMNDEAIPLRHGFPVRLIVPGLYGEKSAKWLNSIELLTADDARLAGRRGFGFYKEQGWGPNFVVPIHSRFDAPEVDGTHFKAPLRVGQPVEFRGMAFSGDQGISRVEVSTDAGRQWANAEIHDPGTKISWSLWKYTWIPGAAGPATLIVRATDDNGRAQIVEPRNTTPQGALGLHTVTADVLA